MNVNHLLDDSTEHTTLSAGTKSITHYDFLASVDVDKTWPVAAHKADLVKLHSNRDDFNIVVEKSFNDQDTRIERLKINLTANLIEN